MNNKGADHTVLVCRLVWAFVVCIEQDQFFLRHGPNFYIAKDKRGGYSSQFSNFLNKTCGYSFKVSDRDTFNESLREHFRDIFFLKHKRFWY